jgi:hypothetical protein
MSHFGCAPQPAYTTAIVNQDEVTTFMNTKNIKDRAERKKVKRTARKKRPPKPKRTEPRGSRKPKVKKRGPGAPPRR